MKYVKCPNNEEHLNPEGSAFCSDCGTDLKKAEFDAKNNPLAQIEDLKRTVAAQGVEIENLKKGKTNVRSEGDEEGRESKEGKRGGVIS